ncbi:MULTISPECIES: TonB-dependent siderophore receptor [unclassified Brenneria]|uniref:TonB-dependent receptor n=1 Tax=unclassified Brenneria TaxID=2634434 RepID=UPI0029C263E2|nr:MULTISPECIES: TonB-dependent siderophore receptor [unclassified Brenneria]MDX5628308.1 TonB-dependent siderophore receptor [Brenneria sp. L3-3Z]MDX5695509.1 TonB-dependent siderophore receptor [Brenneria sp. L4-2C]MEE3662362.1 TonB-dependent siderophore receptor [Brenneria sp. g21c3]
MTISAISQQAVIPRSAPTLLALLIGAAVGVVAMPLAAQTSAAAAQPGASGSKDTITVIAQPEDNFRSGGDELVPAYLDGQIANGGRVGFLGQQNARDVPFNVISYTDKMILSQQAETLADVVKNDASIQSLKGYGNFAEQYRIRGFVLDGDDITFGGLYGVMPRQMVSTNMIERVEVFKGANAFVNGVSGGGVGSGVGGSVNVEPKHAADDALTRATVDYEPEGKVGGALDIGRRFGDNNEFGVRANVLHREGESAIHDQKERMSLASVGLDYRGDRFRTSLDAGYQHQSVHGGRIGVGIGSATRIPEAPDATLNYNPSWVYTDLKTTFGMWRGEYDVADNWTIYSGVGGSRADEEGNYGAPRLTDDNGNATISRMYVPFIRDAFSGMLGLRGQFDTGFIKHNVNLGYSGVYTKARTAWDYSSSRATNIYRPGHIDSPPAASSGGDLRDPKVSARVRSTGLAISDTLSVLDDKVALTLGLRRQEIMVRNYTNNGIESSVFNSMKVTPAYGLVVKPWQHISLYANHIEALSPGKTAPSSFDGLPVVNGGNVTGIYVAKQNEVGVKFDYQRVGGSLALFEIKRPYESVDRASMTYGLYGERRHRGMELNVFGEPTFGLRLNGSATWIAAQQIKTQDGGNDGNDVPGVPRYQLVFGAEYDIKPVEGLTATGTVIRSGSQYVKQDNSLKLKPWTRLDLGVRYSMPLNEQTLTWRANIENVTNENYWASVDDSGTYLYQGDPRSLKLSMSIDF